MVLISISLVNYAEHLFVLFSEMSTSFAYFLVELFCIVLTVVFEGFLIYSRFKSFVGYPACKYFLPFYTS